MSAQIAQKTVCPYCGILAGEAPTGVGPERPGAMTWQNSTARASSTRSLPPGSGPPQRY